MFNWKTIELLLLLIIMLLVITYSWIIVLIISVFGSEIFWVQFELRELLIIFKNSERILMNIGSYIYEHGILYKISSLKLAIEWESENSQ